jgi:hypothetical protein
MSAQDGDLVTEQQDLDVLRCVGSGEQRQPGQHAGDDQVRESKGHGGDPDGRPASRDCEAGRRRKR